MPTLAWTKQKIKFPKPLLKLFEFFALFFEADKRVCHLSGGSIF
jgi:hypothetical protein